MKKKLEAELISIAHRILKLKNKSELDQLYAETQALYEKLAVLRFAENHFGDARPTIGLTDVEDALEAEMPEVEAVQPEPEIVQSEPEVAEPLVAETIEAQEEAVEEESHVQAEAEANEEEPIFEEASEESEAETEPIVQDDDVMAETEVESAQEETESTPEGELPKTTEDELFKPVFEWNFEPKESTPESEQNMQQPQMNFDDLLGSAYKEPEFVKPDEVAPVEPKSNVIPIDRSGDKVQVIKMSEDGVDRSVSLNDRLSKGITVGLNDRIAFVKHLFNNSNEDYNRVLSQLITLDTYHQAKDFIDNMVKPDYNNWDGKEEYEQRFMEVVEKRFS